MKKNKLFDPKDLEFDMDSLDEEEKQIVREMKAGGYKAVPISNARRKELEEMAENTLKRLEREKKEKNINIRVNGKDLDVFKLRATKNGISYQTIIGIFIRQYGEGKIKVDI